MGGMVAPPVVGGPGVVSYPQAGGTAQPPQAAAPAMAPPQGYPPQGGPPAAQPYTQPPAVHAGAQTQQVTIPSEVSGVCRTDRRVPHCCLFSRQFTEAILGVNGSNLQSIKQVSPLSFPR